MQISLCVYLQSHLEFSLKRTLICLDLFLPSLDLIWVNEWKSLSRVRLFMTPWVVHGILQARILEWGAFPFSRGSSQPRDQTQVSRIAADSLPNELSELFSRTARLLAICPKSSGCFMFLCPCLCCSLYLKYTLLLMSPHCTSIWLVNTYLFLKGHLLLPQSPLYPVHTAINALYCIHLFTYLSPLARL